MSKSQNSNPFLTEVEMSDEEMTQLSQYQPDEAKRREQRKTYRNLIRQAKASRNEEHCDATLLATSRTLQEANKVFDEVRTTPEAVLDAQLMYICAAQSKQMACSLPTNLCSFNPMEYVEKLKTHLNGRSLETNDTQSSSLPGNFSWSEFGRECTSFINAVPSFCNLYGKLVREDVPARVRKKPERRQRDESGRVTATVPKEVKDAENIFKEKTTEEVEYILEALWRLYEANERPLCYFEFVTHPTSFSKTCENMFHVSFLVKDGLAKIFLDEDGLPAIVPVTNAARSSQEVSGRRDESRENAIIMTLNMNEWRNIVEAFNITAAAIPEKK